MLQPIHYISGCLSGSLAQLYLHVKLFAMLWEGYCMKPVTEVMLPQSDNFFPQTPSWKVANPPLLNWLNCCFLLHIKRDRMRCGTQYNFPLIGMCEENVHGILRAQLSGFLRTLRFSMNSAQGLVHEAPWCAAQLDTFGCLETRLKM